jgi:TatD DNase family protein
LECLTFWGDDLLVDSHAHLDSTRYEGEVAQILERAYGAGVGAILAIGIGEGPSEMHQALDLCREYNGRPGVPRLYASAGIYPHSTTEADDAALARVSELLAEPEVIACGEIGLDYYHEGAPHDVQKRVFVQQMEIAAGRNRPILIHCRPKDGDNTCWDDTLALLAEHWAPTGIGGILHCFSGEWEHAARAMEIGFLISFAGHLTYPKSQALREVAARVPLEQLLVETDAPYLAPIPNRGQRNEPAWVAHTAATLAGLHGLTPDEMGSVTTKNFERLFRLALDV